MIPRYNIICMSALASDILLTSAVIVISDSAACLLTGSPHPGPHKPQYPELAYNLLPYLKVPYFRGLGISE